MFFLPKTCNIKIFLKKNVNKFPNFIFQTKSNFLYTLNSTKCNGIIYFCLAVKIKEEMEFKHTPLKAYIFYITFFSFYRKSLNTIFCWQHTITYFYFRR